MEEAIGVLIHKQVEYFFKATTMYRALFLAICVCVAANPLPVQCQAQQQIEDQDTKNRAERNRLWTAAKEANAAGELAEAVELGEQMFRLEKDWLGERDAKLIASLTWLVEIYEKQEAWEKAIERQNLAVDYSKQIHGGSDWRTVDSRLALVDLKQRSKITQPERDELDHADQLNQQCVSEYNSRNYVSAIDATTSALSIRLKLLGEEHPDYLESLVNLAVVNQSMGNNKKAERIYEKCKDIYKRVVGEKHPSYARVLYGLAQLHKGMHDYDRAEPLFLQACDIRKEVHGLEHPDYLRSLNGLAHFYKSTGDYARAKSIYLQCCDIRKKTQGKQHLDYANSLHQLAVVHRLTGSYSRAETLFLESLKIRKKILGEHHLDCANTLNSLGVLYNLMNANARAEAFFAKCLDIKKKALGEEHRSYVLTLGNLAKLFEKMGNYDRATPLYRRCLTIQGKLVGEEHEEYLLTLARLGSIYASMGDHVRAFENYQQCLATTEKVFGREHLEYADVLNDFGSLLRTMGELELAEQMYTECLEIRQKKLGEEHESYAIILGNCAGFFRELGRFERAETFFLKCIAIQRKTIGEEHVDYTTTLHNLAVLYESMGDFARAEPLYLKSKETLKKVLGEEHPDYATTLGNLAVLYSSMGDYARAEPLSSSSLSITLNSLKATALIQSERQQLAMNQMLRFRLDNYLSLAINEGQQFRSKAARQVLTWKGSTLVRQRAIRLSASDPAVAEQFKKLQAVASQLASLSRATPDSDQDDWRKRIGQLTADKEKLEAELSRSSAAFRDALKEITPELIQASIPDDAVLIDFLQYSHSKPSKEEKGQIEFTPSLLAVVARRKGEPQLIDLGPRDQLSQAIDQWRETFGMSPQGKQAGTAIRKQIWEPLLESIADAKTVLVSTDGVLGRLPIGALPGKEPGTFLLEDHRIALIPVPQLLPALVHTEGTKALDRELLLFGDVDYDADPESVPKKKRKKRRPSKNRADGVEQEFAQLDGAAGEVAAIQVLYEDLFEADADDVKSLKRANATEVAFREHAAKYRFLHLATHGFFASANLKSALGSDEVHRSSRGRLASGDSEVRGMNPDLLSGLALAGANLEPVAGKDDGILTAQEIAFLPLNGVETAVLSACETGLGEVAGGEGLIGIQRAFQIAGVRTTVASLWKVNDQATRVLMERFYRNLWEKEMGHLDALREAQLYILNNPDSVRSLGVDSEDSTKRSSPKLWAAFQISGDWR